MFKFERTYLTRCLWKSSIFFLLIVTFVGCGSFDDHSEGLKRVLDESGENKIELLKVIKHYSTEQRDSLKLRAANFLIENMYKHEMVSDSAYERYASRITGEIMPISTPDLNSLWDSKYEVEKRKVSQTIKGVDLIADIDEAFEIKEQSKWKDSVEWNVFLSHILPYKVDEEMFVAHWRTTLYNKYKCLLDSVDSPKEAFVRVKTFIRSQSREAKSNFSKSIDPLTMDYLRRGSCAQLDIYTIAVLRALHIPAAYDFIENWGNYSRVGHSWPSYVEGEEITYTLAENDSVLRRFNPIDASYFKEHAEPDDYPFHVSQHKTVYKVYRKHYALQERQMIRDGLIKPSHKEDVSPHYGLHGRVEMDVSSDIAYV